MPLGIYFELPFNLHHKDILRRVFMIAGNNINKAGLTHSQCSSLF